MGRITRSAVAAVVAAALLTACGGGDDTDRAVDGEDAAASAPEAGEAMEGMEGVEEAEPAEGGGDDAAASDADDGSSEARGSDVAAAALDARHIIYRVDLLIETDDIERATQRAAAIATSSGGFVANEHTTVDNDDGSASATLTLRVPSSDHLGIVEQLEELGEVRERGRNVEDVTEEVVDVESRIESQRRSIDRIRRLLEQASDLDDVVRIESELAQREAELDSLLQRQATLSDLTSLATVTATFRLPDGEEPGDEPSDPSFLSGLSTGWNAFVETATVGGAVVGAVLPFAVTAGIVAVPAWLLWRRRRSAAPMNPTAPATPATSADVPGTTAS